MNEITIFKNERFGEVRTATSESGEPLFAAVDVARALGYANTRDAISKHCKRVTKRDGVARTTNQHGVVTNQVVEMSFINEGDVIRLIMRSKLPQAEAFQDRSDAAKSGVFRYCVIFVVSDYYQHDSRKVGNKCPKVK